MNFSKFMIIGKFFPNNSFIHNLDPRSKLIFTFIYVLVIFMASNIMDYLVLIIIIAILFFSAKIPPSFYLKGLFPVFWLILITFFIHLTMTKGGELVFQWYVISIYSYGIQQAFFISFRIMLLVLIASFLTLTTTPIDLTIGLERLFYLLKKIKVPVSDLALMMSLSLRFIPTLLEETEKIIKAQTARGARFNSGSLIIRFKSVTAIIVPLFINAFKRADQLALAMESRGFKGSEGRTRLRVIKFTYQDLLFLISTLILVIIMIYTRGL